MKSKTCRFQFANAAVLAATLLVPHGLRWGGAEARAGEKDSSPKTQRLQQKARKDIHGDALPEGAVARLGTVRWRGPTDMNFVVFAPGGKSLITTKANGRCTVWDRSTGRPTKQFGPTYPTTPNTTDVRRLRTRFPTEPLCVATTNDQKTIAIAKGKKITLWNTSTGKEINRFENLTQNIQALAISSSAKLLAWQESSGQIHLLNLKTGKKISTLGQQNQTGNSSFRISPYGNKMGALLRFSPDGNMLCAGAFKVTTSGRRTYGYLELLELWNTKTGKKLYQIGGNGPGRNVPLAVTFSTNSKLIACRFSTGFIELFNSETGKKIRQLQSNTTVINRNSDLQQLFTPDGKSFVEWEPNGGNLNVYQVRTGKKIHGHALGSTTTTRIYYPTYAQGEATVKLAVSPNSRTVALLKSSGTIHCIDLATGKDAQQFAGHLTKVASVSYPPDGKTIVTQSSTGSVRFWDAKSGQPIRHFVPPSTTTANQRLYSRSYRISEDGSTLAIAEMGYAVGGVFRNITLYDTKTKKKLPLLELPKNDPQAGRSIYNQSTLVALSHDGKRLALVVNNGGITGHIYETRTGKRIQELFVRPAPNQNPNRGGFISRSRNASAAFLGFSPNGNYLAIPEDGQIGIWDLAQAKKLSTIPVPKIPTRTTRTTAPPNTVEGAKFSPDGRMFGLVLTNGEARVYEALTGEKRIVFPARKAQPSPKTPITSVPTVAFYAALLRMASEYNALAFSPDSRIVAFRNGTDSTIQFADLRTGKKLSQITGHTGKILAIAFSPTNDRFVTTSEDTTGLVWDLETVRKQLENSIEPLTAAQLQQSWSSLLNINGEIAFLARNTLIKNAPGTVKLLENELRPTPAISPKEIAKLIEQLDAQRFRTRIAAYTKLQKLGIKARSQLEEAQKGNRPLEVQTRIKLLLDAISERPLDKNQLRVWRAIEVLERINTSQSRGLLTKLARGAPGVFPTNVAKQALERLNR
ncbi:MAG: WD40 repeat domain-containing protein [Gemmataceae bacterium]